jgi:predicted  nucleic acid-binding Zn-ribbon protein
VKTYLEIPCPKCQRKLRIPTEYLGKRLSCKYCEHVFQPDVKDVPAAADSANQQLAQLQAELTARAAEHANALKDAQWARAEAARLQEQMQALALAAEKVDARHRQEIEIREEALAKFAAEVEQLQDSPREDADTQSQQAADECARLQNELDGLQRQFTEEQTALQRAAEEARSDAAALRQEHTDVLHLLEAAKSECERLASAHGDLEATHSDTKQNLEGELARLTALLDVHRQGHAELTEKLHGAHGERTSLHAALQEARTELETRATEAGRLQEQIQGLQAAAEAAELKYREDTVERQRALAAVRREVLELRARAEHIPVRERENEQLIGENASLSAELEVAQQEVQALRQAAEQAQTRQFEEDEHRQKSLASVRAEAARLLTDVKALEERAQQAQLLEARLQDAWTVTTRLEGELALANAARNDLFDRLATAEAQAQQLQALRSERDQLADHVKALQADLAQAPGQEGASFKNAVGAAFAEVVRPKGEASTNEKVARALAGPNNSAMANEVARLKQENAQLRQWLAQCGVLPM